MRLIGHKMCVFCSPACPRADDSCKAGLLVLVMPAAITSLVLRTYTSVNEWVRVSGGIIFVSRLSQAVMQLVQHSSLHIFKPSANGSASSPSPTYMPWLQISQSSMKYICLAKEEACKKPLAALPDGRYQSRHRWDGAKTRSPAMVLAGTQPFYPRLRYSVRQHNILLWPSISRDTTSPAMAMLAALVTIPDGAKRVLGPKPTATAILLFFIAADEATFVVVHTRSPEITQR